MFDKVLCKHIQKKTITSGDVVEAMVTNCIYFGILLLVCYIIGAVSYELAGYDMSVPLIRYFASGTVIGMFELAVIYVLSHILKIILKIEVAHCPVKDENGGIGK